MIEDDINDINVLWRTLDKAYIPKNYQRALKDEFRSCKKKTSETMKHYCINLQQLYLQGHIEASPKEVAENVRDQMLLQISQSEMDYCFPFINKEDPEEIADDFDAVFTEMKRFNKGNRRDADLALESMEKSREAETQVTVDLNRSHVPASQVVTNHVTSNLNPNAPVFPLHAMSAHYNGGAQVVPAYGQTPAPAQFVPHAQAPVQSYPVQTQEVVQQAPQAQVSYPQPTGNPPYVAQQQSPPGNGNNNYQGQNGGNQRSGGNQGQRNGNRGGGNNRNQPRDYSNAQCWHCGGYGHLKRKCPDIDKPATANIQSNNNRSPPDNDSKDTNKLLNTIAKKMMQETAKLESQNMENTLRLEERMQEIVTNSLKATGLAPQTGTKSQTKA